MLGDNQSPGNIWGKLQTEAEAFFSDIAVDSPKGPWVGGGVTW
jgi:hypothetical protein